MTTYFRDFKLKSLGDRSLNNVSDRGGIPYLSPFLAVTQNKIMNLKTGIFTGLGEYYNKCEKVE